MNLSKESLVILNEDIMPEMCNTLKAFSEGDMHVTSIHFKHALSEYKRCLCHLYRKPESTTYSTLCSVVTDLSFLPLMSEDEYSLCSRLRINPDVLEVANAISILSKGVYKLIEKLASDVAEESSLPNPEALAWCRSHAPDSVRLLADDDVWAYMGQAYKNMTALKSIKE